MISHAFREGRVAKIGKAFGRQAIEGLLAICQNSAAERVSHQSRTANTAADGVRRQWLRDRTRTAGLINREGIWHIDKRFRGRRLCESTGEGDLAKAQEYLTRRLEEARQASLFGERPSRSFRQATIKYLEENRLKRSIADDALHLRQLIGSLAICRLLPCTWERYVRSSTRGGVKAERPRPSIWRWASCDISAAGVSFEDRQDLLGHRSARITTHYSAAELQSLLEAANPVCEAGSRKTPALVMLKRKAPTAVAVSADWIAVWEGARPGDLKEFYRLYRRDVASDHALVKFPQ